MSKKSTKNAKGGGTIRKRSDGRWEGRYSIGLDPQTGKQIQKSVYGATQKEVRQKLTKITNDLDEDIYLEPCRMKLGVWLDTWLKDYTGNVKPKTYSAYEGHVRVHIKPYLGNVSLNKLTPHMVQQMYNLLLNEKGLAPKTVKNIHGVFHRAMDQAMKLGYLRLNPLNAVILPRVEKPRIEIISSATVVFSSVKTDRIRVLNVSKHVMDKLRQQQMIQKCWADAAGSAWNNADDLVFTNELGSFIKNKTLYMHFKRISSRIGLGNLRFHALRHTYAVNSLRAGDDIKTVQENLGHTTAAFTLGTYAHATPGMKRESAKRMDDYIELLESTPYSDVRSVTGGTK